MELSGRPSGRLINLADAGVNSVVQKFMKMENTTHAIPAWPSPELPGLDFGKEIRNSGFSIVHLLLQHPLSELLSTAPPNAASMSQNCSYLYLYDGCVDAYQEDGIAWKSTKKMSLKLVVCDRDKGVYRLKNKKDEDGEAVMRRQTWQGLPSSMDNSEWRKHEYKLITRVSYYKAEPDGSLSLTQTPSLQKFPVLVHYYCKRSAKKIKAEDSPPRFPAVEPCASDSMQSSLSDAMQSSQSALFPDLEPFFMAHSSPAAMVVPPATPEPAVSILSYAPDGGHYHSDTKVLVVLDGALPQLWDECEFVCQVDHSPCQVPMQRLRPGVLSMTMPERSVPGVTTFRVVMKHGDTDARCSDPHFFLSFPTDAQGKLCLAFHALEHNPQLKEVVRQFRFTTRELDLSYNHLTSLDFLEGFQHLHTLILDHNQLESLTGCPVLATLETLFMNSNVICDLRKLVDGLCSQTPRLRHLSLMNNRVCPMFEPHHYYNYRIYVLSRIPCLVSLDSKTITADEQRHAQCLQGSEAPQTYSDVFSFDTL